MRKVALLFAFLCLFAVGCENGHDEVTYTRSSNETSLKISHRCNGSTINVTVKNAEEARKYRERLQRLVKEIEDFEKELSIREKN